MSPHHLDFWKGLSPPTSDQAWGGPFWVGFPPPRPQRRSTAHAFSALWDIPGTSRPGPSWQKKSKEQSGQESSGHRFWALPAPGPHPCPVPSSFISLLSCHSVSAQEKRHCFFLLPDSSMAERELSPSLSSFKIVYFAHHGFKNVFYSIVLKYHLDY